MNLQLNFGPVKVGSENSLLTFARGPIAWHSKAGRSEDSGSRDAARTAVPISSVESDKLLALSRLPPCASYMETVPLWFLIRHPPRESEDNRK